MDFAEKEKETAPEHSEAPLAEKPISTRLYSASRDADALAIEPGLSKLLAVADADHPILRELRRPLKS